MSSYASAAKPTDYQRRAAAISQLPTTSAKTLLSQLNKDHQEFERKIKSLPGDTISVPKTRLETLIKGQGVLMDIAMAQTHTISRHEAAIGSLQKIQESQAKEHSKMLETIKYSEYIKMFLNKIALDLSGDNWKDFYIDNLKEEKRLVRRFFRTPDFDWTQIAKFNIQDQKDQIPYLNKIVKYLKDEGLNAEDMQALYKLKDERNNIGHPEIQVGDIRMDVERIKECFRDNQAVIEPLERMMQSLQSHQ